ncbi:MAG: Indolepyruvate oxidoreductase subunit IorA [Methanosaeta sp. PtaU1.Bin112]|nr:MAG: Indolepyruvate oxidoreductase subunit IorA [Methanosaeta sp. PtaU1.Bin112]
MAMHAASCEVATCVPGLGATEIFCDFFKIKSQIPVFSFHEEVAYTIAHGAALAGKRAITIMKAHGFFKAANSVSDSLYSGTLAGFVTIVVDDRNGIQSDSIADTKSFVEGVGIPHKVANVQEVFEDIIEGFLHSEKVLLPFALIIDAGDLEQLSRIPAKRCIDLPSEKYTRDITQNVLCPPFCKYQRDILRCKLSGGNWRAIKKPSLRPLFETLPEKWMSVAEQYSIIFEALRSAKGEIAAGDTGLSTLFALAPYDCIDVTTYMGGSLPLALGVHLAGVRPAWAISGDFSFIAAGHLGLLEAVQRQIPLKVLLLCNGKAETTGGQKIPGGVLERILRGYEEYVHIIHDPLDQRAVESAIKSAAGSPELSILVAKF